MRAVIWWIVACIGMFVMVWAYRADRPADAAVPFSSGFLVVAKTASLPKHDAIPFPSTEARVRRLPLDGFAALVVGSAAGVDADRAARLEFQLSEKLFELSLQDAGIAANVLAWGRLPRAGQNEVIAGYRAAHGSKIEVAGRTFSVVGGLPRDEALFARSYLVPRDPDLGGDIDPADKTVRAVILISLTPEQLSDRQIDEQLKARFPQEQFDRVASLLYTERGPFFGFLCGQALFCLGGSGILIGLYAAAASRVRWPFLRDPLAEISSRRRLVWGVHLAYFGLYLLVAIAVYQAPDVQNTFVAVLQREIKGGEGPLGIAGKAYGSRNIPLAALVTFVINFFLGSAALLTIPSCVIPGSGALVAAFRAVSWGIVLAPSTRLLAGGMLPHSGTLLLEGEGYILATFFGLLMPLYLFRRDSASSLFARYRRGFVLNLKGNVLVALVLLIAAIYESIEVILMIK
jgi:hypothetical protein